MRTSGPSPRRPILATEPRGAVARATFTLAVLALASVSATACGSGKSGAAAAGTTATATASASTLPSSSAPQTTETTSTATGTTATPTTTAAPTTASAPTSEFPAAKTAWEQGSTVADAVRGRYWQAAEEDLIASDTASYASAIGDLKQLVGLPDAMETPAQQAESKADVAALDDFFGTPGLYED